MESKLKKLIKTINEDPEKDLSKYIDKLIKYDYKTREYISLNSKLRELYINEEVEEVRKNEENILNDIIPTNMKNLMKLNILNIGAGGRTINESLISVDFQRDLEILNNNGHTANSIISNMSELPFKENTIDGIIALHVYEHTETPVETLTEWLRVVKPGGKIGIIVPNFMYNWSASNDHFMYGHKWNTEPEIFLKLLKDHFPLIKILKFNTLKHKLSFDIVLQKPGEYKIPSDIIFKSGFELDMGKNKDVGYYYYNGKCYL